MAKTNTTDGYDPHVGARNRVPGGSNGRLRTVYNWKSNGQTNLWVSAVETGFGLSGSTQQSEKTRTFSPRNRTQQSITVTCQFPSQVLYGDAVEWIRARHLDRTTALSLMIKRQRQIKGLGAVIHAYGYIKDAPRIHERFVYAPELTFEFLVSKTISPVGWRDAGPQEGSIGKMTTWREVLKSRDLRSLAEPDSWHPPLAPPDADGVDPGGGG